MASTKKHIHQHIYSLILALACLCAIMSCSGTHSYPKDLAMADSLCKTNPDSAMAYLKTLSKEYANSSDAYNRNYFLLLTVKAANNAYKPIKDSTIFRVMDFYENASDKEKLCQSYYYVGKYYAEKNDAPQSISYYQKALSLTDKNTPISFLSRIYNQSGSKYLVQDIYDKALEMYEKSYDCDSIANDSIGMIYNLRDIATVYVFQKRYNESIALLHKALHLAKNTDDDGLIRCIWATLANSYYDAGNYKMSKQCLKEPLKGMSDIEMSDVYVLAAKLYYHENKADSMLFFSEKLMNTNNYYAKRTLSLILSEFYLKKGDNINALKYNKLFKVFSDSINRATAIETVAKLNSVYNYKLREEENEKLKTSEKEKIYILAIVILCGVVAVSLLLCINERNKKRYLQFKQISDNLQKLQEQTHLEAEKLLNDKSDAIIQLKEEIEKQKAASENDKKDYEKRIADLQEKLNDYDKNSSTELAGIYDIIKNRLDAQKNLSQNEWDEVDDLLENVYPCFKDKLYAIDNLKTMDYRVCVLTKLGFSNSDIAVLINRSAPATSIKRGKLYNKLTCKNGTAKDFDEFIKSL